VIRSRRRAHAWVFAALPLVLTLVLLAAWHARRAPLYPERLPAVLLERER